MLPVSQYDAVLCRGVLNDLIDDDARASAFRSFNRVLRKGGVLVLDVREWEATSARKSREPLFRKRVDTERGKLTFTSVTQLDVPTRRLLVKERHTLESQGRDHSSNYDFVMRCWTPGELQSLLSCHGFGLVQSPTLVRMIRRWLLVPRTGSSQWLRFRKMRPNRR